MSDLRYQELIQQALKGTLEDGSKAKKERSQQMGLFGDTSEERKQDKTPAVKKERDKRVAIQSDMFEKEAKDIQREKEEKRFTKQQKLEDRPLPKNQRMPSTGSTSGGGIDVEGLPKKLKGGLKNFKAGGSVSASKRADGCAVKGKTKGRIV